MKDINVTPTVQVLGVLAVAGAVAAAVGAQLPELKRYMKVRGM